MEKEKVLDVLRRVYDPDYRDRSVVDMGLVSAADIVLSDEAETGEERIEIEYGVTAPMCPFSAALGVMIQYALEKSWVGRWWCGSSRAIFRSRW